MEELLKKYESKRNEIKKRLDEFKQMCNQPEERIFAELVFCLLTPQSKATHCWKAVEALMQKNLLLSGTEEQIKPFLNAVRFRENKAKYIIEARKVFQNSLKKIIFSKKSPFEIREWLVKNVKGLGMKEASHFLRNIGLGNGIAILDRHILKNLLKYGVIKEIPKNLNKKNYLKIEKAMLDFAKKINIPIEELDLLFWSEETGFVFK
jgi:N-glycosylase/DNA lyase